MSVIKYSYEKEGEKYLSEHFRVGDFASVNGNRLYSDEILVDSRLVEMLEKLFSYLNCDSMRIISGYRTTAHDRSVRGNGYGHHTKGMAADVICYDENGVISAKIVCCAASDIGFFGVANISSDFKAVHLDVREGNRFLGDRSVGEAAIWRYYPDCTDFYRYFGLSDEVTSKYTKGKNMTKYYTYSNNKPQGIFYNGETGGCVGEKLGGIFVISDYFNIRCRVHTPKKGWLPWTDKNRPPRERRYKILNEIDGIQISSQSSCCKAVYRAACMGEDFLPWVTEYNNIGSDGYAGVFGKPIERIEAVLKHR